MGLQPKERQEHSHRKVKRLSSLLKKTIGNVPGLGPRLASDASSLASSGGSMSVADGRWARRRPAVSPCIPSLATALRLCVPAPYWRLLGSCLPASCLLLRQIELQAPLSMTCATSCSRADSHKTPERGMPSVAYALEKNAQGTQRPMRLPIRGATVAAPGCAPTCATVGVPPFPFSSSLPRARMHACAPEHPVHASSAFMAAPCTTRGDHG